MKVKETNEFSGLMGIGSRFEGQIRFEGTFRIDGELYGQVICKNDKPSVVIITELATVEADIIADHVVISGAVSGNIKAIESLELISPGRLEGLVYTSDLSIGDGALFQGECVMIRHLNREEKQMLKMEGFYSVHHQLIHEGRKTIVDIPDQAGLLER